MKSRLRAILAITAGLFVLVMTGAVCRLCAKEKPPSVSSDDPTLRLYQLLDSQYGGKLPEFYLLADLVTDPDNPDHVEQRVLKVEYNKNNVFGKLRIYVRRVDKLTPAQLKAYTPKDIFEYGETDSAKFTKTDPGSFGRTGDVYFEPVSPGGPLGTAPVTDAVRATYDHYVIKYIIPALEKKGGATGS
jgi:hypothetical protein